MSEQRGPDTTVSREQWLIARKQLLAREKELTRLRDQLSEQRRALPRVKIDAPYAFDGPAGRQTLAQLFAGRSQLVVYHLMFHPDWEAACKSCSFWADHFDGIGVHLAQRDVSFVAIARAPYPKLAAFAARMGWRFRLLSSHGSDFNRDFGASLDPDALARGAAEYNYAPTGGSQPERPGVSVFMRDARGDVFHTYSCYGRGIEALNATYGCLDLLPRGRDEAGLPYPMAWVQLHDQYPR